MLAGVWLLVNLATLTRYPAATCDEAFYGRSALAYVQAALAGASWPAAGLNFYLPYGRAYWLLLGAVLRLAGPDLFAARAVSLLGWGALIAAAYRLARRSGASLAASRWAAALIAVAWLPWFAGHRVRPDVWAAAAAALAISCLPAPDESPGVWRLAGGGLLLAGGLLFHPVAAYLAGAAVVVWSIQLLRARQLAGMGALALAFALGALLIGWWHLGAAAGPLAAGALADPVGFLRRYNLAGAAGAPPGPLPAAAAAVRWYAGFWWSSYAWSVPIIALPQAALFLGGLAYGVAGPEPRLRALTWTCLLGSLLFALINAGYTAPPGYAVQWMPGYAVLSVQALTGLSRRFRPPPRLRIAWDSFGLAGLLALYLAGAAYLLRTYPPAEYRRVGQALAAAIPAGRSVLSSPIWWYAIGDRVVFLDETQIAPRYSILWWNSVPAESADAAAPALIPIVPSLPSAARAAALAGQQLAEASRPDYVVQDAYLGCLSAETALGEAARAEVARSCHSVRAVESAVYGSQIVYACRWP